MLTVPRVFVASSREAERLARAVQQNLNDAEVTVWTQAFQIGHVIVDELRRNLERSDFGVFIFAPTDVVNIRGQTQLAARDNVVLELGIFIGRLGKERSFIIQPQHVEMRLPTDLLGVITGQYDQDRAAREPAAALGVACTQISDAIKRQHTVMASELNTTMTEALQTICRIMSAPVTPEKASLRAFVFRQEGEELVCRHFWDPSESEETSRRPASASMRKRPRESSSCAASATTRCAEAMTTPHGGRWSHRFRRTSREPQERSNPR
jgi:CAP12/Pycsar effector protein, TIR domain